MKEILGHLFYHLLLGLLVGFFSWWLTGSFKLGIVGMLVNIFMDLDHLFEYLVFSRRFRLKEFLSGAHFSQKGKILVIFHAWEYVVLGLIFWRLFSQPVFLVVALALFTHLVFDQLSWQLSPWAYFISYRVKNGFAIDKVCQGGKK